MWADTIDTSRPYNIGELTTLVGITPRTVQRKVRGGLLPEPTKNPGNLRERLFTSKQAKEICITYWQTKIRINPNNIDALRAKVFGTDHTIDNPNR